MNYQFEWSAVWAYRDLLLSGIGRTCLLTLISSPLGLAAGCIFGIMRLSRFRTFRLAASIYVEGNRNIPVVVKLFFLYFVFGLSPMLAAILGLVIHQSAYIAEDVRSAVQSIPRGQGEAALSTGLTRWLTTRFVILPQALKIATPALTVQLIELLKNSSIAMVITVEELTFASQQITSETFRGFEVATVSTLIYFVLAAIVSRVGNALGTHLPPRLPIEAPTMKVAT
jgi:polar amino acid transport system permease protein